MRTLGRMWRGLWRVFRRYRESRDEAESGELESGGMWIRPALRLAIVFALLFGCVFFAFWWAGSAVRFSAERVADRTAPAWRGSGTGGAPRAPPARFPGGGWRMPPPPSRHFFTPTPTIAAFLSC